MKAKFKKAIEEKDIISVRIFLSNELLLDPRGRSFNKMKTFAENNISDLYEPDDGRNYDTPISQWDKDFLFKVKNDLDTNFSEIQLSFYEKVAKEVLKEKAILLDEEEQKFKAKEQKSKEVKEIRYKKKIYTGVTIAGVAVAGVAIAVADTTLKKCILASLGLAGAVIGGVLLYKESQK